MTTIEVTIGWTKHGERSAFEVGDYVPFWDPFRPGQPQHTITVTLDLDIHGHVPPEGWVMIVEMLAEAAYEATNSPSPTTGSELAQQIYLGILETGYRGEEGGHYSLSIGDTVTVGEVMLGCTREGWVRVSQVGQDLTDNA